MTGGNELELGELVGNTFERKEIVAGNLVEVAEVINLHELSCTSFPSSHNNETGTPLGKDSKCDIIRARRLLALTLFAD